MPSKNKVRSMNSMKLGAARDLQALKKAENFAKLPFDLHPRQFSEEAFEWHRTSLPPRRDYEDETVLWYLDSQQEYFNQVKAEAMETMKTLKYPTAQNWEIPAINNVAGPSNKLKPVTKKRKTAKTANDARLHSSHKSKLSQDENEKPVERVPDFSSKDSHDVKKTENGPETLQPKDMRKDSPKLSSNKSDDDTKKNENDTSPPENIESHFLSSSSDESDDDTKKNENHTSPPNNVGVGSLSPKLSSDKSADDTKNENDTTLPENIESGFLSCSSDESDDDPEEKNDISPLKNVAPEDFGEERKDDNKIMLSINMTICSQQLSSEDSDGDENGFLQPVNIHSPQLSPEDSAKFSSEECEDDPKGQNAIPEPNASNNTPKLPSEDSSEVPEKKNDKEQNENIDDDLLNSSKDSGKENIILQSIKIENTKWTNLPDSENDVQNSQPEAISHPMKTQVLDEGLDIIDLDYEEDEDDFLLF